jgi:4a-hydroxytetrahydrobiopterin dehydratase
MKNLQLFELIPMRKDSPKLSVNEIRIFISENPDWNHRIPSDNTFLQNQDVIFRKYKFNDFEQAVRFSRKIADLANKVNHHPTLIIDWGVLNVIWTTHSIHGLHNNDLIMAKNSDILFQEFKNQKDIDES